MKHLLRIEWELFLLAVQFLTRLPVPRELPFSDVGGFGEASFGKKCTSR